MKLCISLVAIMASIACAVRLSGEQLDSISDVDAAYFPRRKYAERRTQRKATGGGGAIRSYGYKSCTPKRCPGIDRTQMPAKSLQDILAQAETGDLLLISGNAKSSKAIRWHTGSFWSHVAVVVKDVPPAVWTQYGKLRSNTPVPTDAPVYIFDSDYEPDGSVDGPVIRPLETMLKAYIKEYGECVDVAFRKLTAPDRRVDQLWQFANEVAGMKYTAQTAMDPNFFKLWAGTVGINNKEDTKRIFCSQLVARAFRKMGLLPKEGKKSGNFMPQDFASPHGESRSHKSVDINTLLQGGAELALETRVDLTSVGGYNTCPR